MAVDGIDDLAVVDERVVDLAGAGRGVRHLRHKIGHLLRLVRVGDVEGAQPAVEEGAEHDLVRLPAIRLRQILPQIMRAEPAAAPREAFDRRHRAGRDRHRVLLGAVVDDPHQLRPVDPVIAGAFIADDQQVALEQRHDGVGEAVIRRVVVPARDHLRVRLVGDVEDDHAAVDIAHVHAVRPLGINVGIVRPEAGVLVALMTRRRRHIVARRRAGQPPAADLDRLRRVAHIDALVELVVLRVGRAEIGRARAHMDVFAVGEPQLVDAARMRPGAVEEGDPARVLRHRDVEQLEAGLRVAGLLRLIGDREDVADCLQRVRAHFGVWQVGAGDDLRLPRVADIDRGEVLRRAFMGHPQDAPSVLGQLHRHAFAHAAKPVERVVPERLEIPDQRAAIRLAALGHSLSPHRGVLRKS